MMSKIIYLIRHAEPLVHNNAKLGLSLTGITQAAIVGRTLASNIQTKDCKVYFATVKRCEQTADIIAGMLDIKKDLANIRFKGVEHLKMTNVKSKYSTYIQNYQRLGIENPKVYLERMFDFFRSRPEGTSIVISNYVNMRLLLQELGSDDYSRISHADCFEILLHDNTKKGTIRKIT